MKSLTKIKDIQERWKESTREELERRKSELDEVRIRIKIMQKEHGKIKWLKE